MLKFHCFGHFYMADQHANLVFNVRPNTRRLLLYLLLNRSHALSRKTVAFTLWPDTSESNALATLRRNLYSLNSALPDDQEWIIKSESTLQWNPHSRYWLDIAEFERLCRLSDYRSKAFDLYTDDLLIEYDDSWIEPERERLRNLYLNTLQLTIEHYQQQGRLKMAINVALQALAYDPCQEAIVQDLMQLYYQDGNRAAAIKAFEDFKANLWQEIGVKPMDETTDLFEAICRDALESNTPLRVSKPSVPFTVPAPVTSFVGREKELLELSDLLIETDAARHITLLGPPGIGKTRLATEVARRLRPFYPDGVFFVNLSDVSDTEQVGPAIALQVLAAVNPTIKPTVEALKEYIQERYLLLVIDNFEQVLDARAIIDDIRKSSMGIQLLVTSRFPLKLYGEYEYSLRLLEYPTADIELKVAHEYSALDLFAERSRQRLPSFTLTEGNLPAVTNICSQLDGLPLAIELVAARVGEMDLSDIERELNERFDLLTSDYYGIDPRHRSLHAAITWSVDLLSIHMQRAFVQLGIFATGWTLEAAQQVLDASVDAEKLMETLGNHHLITSHETDYGERFDMLVSIREFAHDKLMATRASTEIYRRFASYFADLAEEARTNWHSEQIGFWLDRLRMEEENLRRALRWAFDDDEAHIENRTLYGVRLSSALNRFWQAQGKAKEGLDWMEKALPFASHLDANAYIVFIIRLVSFTTNIRQDYNTAIQLLEEALSIAHNSDDMESVAKILNETGLVFLRQGNLEEAVLYLEDALRFLREITDSDPVYLSTIVNNLAVVKKNLGEYDAGETLFHEALELRRQTGDVSLIAGTLVNLGNLAIEREQFLQAKDLYLEALSLVVELNHQDKLRAFFYGFGHIAWGLNQAEHCVRITGFADAFALSVNRPLSPPEIERREEKLTIIRDLLGYERVEILLAEGAQMSLEEMLDYITETFS